MMEMIDEIRIAELIARSIAGEMPPDQQLRLDAWLAQSAQNREMYQRLASGESLKVRRENFNSLNINDVLDKIDSKAGKHRRRRIVRRSASVAAILVVAILSAMFIGDLRNVNWEVAAGQTHQAILSFADGSRVVLCDSTAGDEWMQYVGTEQMQPTDAQIPAAAQANIIKVEVQRGKEYKLMLPDSSMVWLNSESSIEYPAVFANDRREVNISGEIFFDVDHDAQRPFVITTTDSLKITVLGTKFNVNSYTDGEQIHVSLIEGKVSVAGNGENVTLHPNQQARYDRNNKALSVHTVSDASIYSSWIDGLFEFEKERLEVILGAMAKWYDIEFVFSGVDIEQLGHFTIHTERGSNFSSVSQILTKITGLNYNIEGKTVSVSYR